MKDQLQALIKFYAKYKMLLFPGVVGLSSLFLIFFVIYPQVVKLITNQKRQDDLVNKSLFLEQKVSALEGYNGEDLARKLEYTFSAFPQDKDFGNVIGLLQSLTGQSGFTINSLALENMPKQTSSELSYGIKMEVTGAKALVPNLLGNLEASPRLIKINTIEISSSVSQASNVTLSIAILYAPIPQNLGSLDTPLPRLNQKDEDLISKLARIALPSQISDNTSFGPRGKSNPFE